MIMVCLLHCLMELDEEVRDNTNDVTSIFLDTRVTVLIFVSYQRVYTDLFECDETN